MRGFVKREKILTLIYPNYMVNESSTIVQIPLFVTKHTNSTYGLCLFGVFQVNISGIGWATRSKHQKTFKK